MRLRIPTFLGTFPRTSPRLLKDTAAQRAVNTDLRRGSLRPFRALKPVATPGKAAASSLYLFGDTWWFSWASDVNVVKGPVAGDTLERTYWTGDGAYPKMTTSAIATAGSDYPAASYRLGIPKPASPLICSVTGSATETDASLKETRFYVYTYVSALGEEGPPSVPSAAIDWMPGQGVALSGFSTAPTGAYNIATKRIYRTNAGTGSAAYQFVAEVPVSQTAYADTVPSANLAEVLPSETWVAPPDGLKGLCVLPNGVLAGFTANEICFSEPFQPHAWPVGYRLTTDRNVVGIGNFDTTVVVATEGVPYLIHGTDPQGLSMQALNINQACVSKRSVVSMGDPGVCYASADGLVLVGPNGAQLVTEAIITPGQWQALAPSSIHGYQVDSKYFGFYAVPGGARGGFLFDVRRPEDGIVWTDVYAEGGYPAPKAASVFLLVGGRIVEWDAGSGSLTQTWRSKQAVIGQPVNFAVCQVEASGYGALVARIYADGVLRHTHTVSSRNPFRLPGGFLSTVWEVEIEGTEEVHEVNLSTSTAELAT